MKAGRAFERYARILCAGMLLASCARVLPPEGGPKDETPPRLDTLHSTPPLKTSFRPRQLIFQFDEWIQVRDALKQVVISPPVRRNPQVVVKGKSLTVTFDDGEPWRDSTTYILSFGKAVSDRSEGNVVPDLKYVFSTGPVLDSLQAEGTLVDARTRRPLEDVLILLHRSPADSAVTLELPAYFARTDKEGSYRLEHLREGQYRLYALDDRNGNYLYDQPDERLTGLEALVRIGTRQDPFPLLELSPPVKKARLIAMDSTREAGRTDLIFNRRPAGVTVTDDSIGGPVMRWTRDTVLSVWQSAGSPMMWIKVDGDSIRLPGGPDTLPFLTAPPVPVLQGIQPPNAPLRFVCHPPIVFPDTTRIRIHRDTQAMEGGVIGLSPDGDTLSIRGVAFPEATVTIRFLPGALMTLNGAIQNDSLAVGVTVGSVNDWGTLTLLIDRLPEETPVLLEIVDSRGVPVTSPMRSVGQTTWRILLPPLPPGTYEAFVSLDVDGNGRWDGADHYRGRKGEPRSAHLLPALRGNWELEVPFIPEWAIPGE